jgi:uncharacterized protein (TIGR02996 family)
MTQQDDRPALSPELPNEIPARRFEYADDKSYKFWTITLSAEVLTMRFGRIGSEGTERVVAMESVEAAKREYLKRIQQKTNSGYQERIPKKKPVVPSQQIWQELQGHEPFLQAILESPDDPTGYAIYADWLIEQDDPRGRFTQLQVMLDDPKVAFYQKARIEKEARQIQQMHVRRFLGSLTPWLMDKGLQSYPYKFFWGQLSSLQCYTLSLQFADELRRSPYCRFLRELSVFGNEILSQPLEISGRRWAANVDHGLEILLGADFTNLRELRLGLLADYDLTMPHETINNTTHLIDIIQSAKRLRYLGLGAKVDLPTLYNCDLPCLESISLNLRTDDLRDLSDGKLYSQLKSLEALNPISDAFIEAIVELPGFDRLSEFTCRQISPISRQSLRLLENTGVVFRVISSLNSAN